MTAAEQVEHEWSWLLARDDMAEGVKDMIRHAAERPALRRLFPFLSLKRSLRFSGTTREPFTWDRPFAMHVGGSEYEARAASGAVLASGSLEVVLDAVVAALPRPDDAATDEEPPES